MGKLLPLWVGGFLCGAGGAIPTNKKNPNATATTKTATPKSRANQTARSRNVMN